MIIPKTKQDLELLDGACNGTAVANTLSKVYKEVLNDIKNTDIANRHWAVRYYLIKLCDLAGLVVDNSSETFIEAERKTK